MCKNSGDADVVSTQDHERVYISQDTLNYEAVSKRRSWHKSKPRTDIDACIIPYLVAMCLTLEVSASRSPAPRLLPLAAHCQIGVYNTPTYYGVPGTW